MELGEAARLMRLLTCCPADSANPAYTGTTMNAHSVWQRDDLYTGTTQSGHSIQMDASDQHAEGPSPMELILTALCGCTSVDVVSILQKKRQPFTGLRVSASSQRAAEAPRVFTAIHLTYTVSGTGLSRKAVEDAVSLSKNKYCSVSKMLEKAAEVTYSIEFPDGEPLA